MSKATGTSAIDVLLFYPNIIGYFRIMFMLLSFTFAHINWKLTLMLYQFAFVGDLIDGYVARSFKQST